MEPKGTRGRRRSKVEKQVGDAGMRRFQKNATERKKSDVTTRWIEFESDITGNK